MNLRVYPDWMMREAEVTLDIIESDFGHSGRDVRLETIRCTLWSAHERGMSEAKDCACPGGPAQHLKDCVYVR